MNKSLKKIALVAIASIATSLALINVRVEVASARTLKGLINIASQDINQYWKYQMNSSGRRYVPPKLYPYTPSQPVKTACGLSIPNNATYCRLDNSISFDVKFLIEQHNKSGDYAIVNILAHEWGHLIQNQMGISRANYYGIQLELQADCFAGAYARKANDTGLLEIGDLEEAVRTTIDVADKGVPWFDPQAHGTARQRVSALLIGLNGPAACFSRY